MNLYQRTRARRLAVKSAYLLLHNAQAVHYTQDAVQRWEGIRLHKRAYLGQYPAHSDCSASTTWMLWDATRSLKLPDVVNATNWQSGYTGTQQQHGVRVGLNRWRFLRGDLVFYGDQGGGVAEHVAIYVGGGQVISQGSEAGPFLLPWAYRPVNEVRRYLR